MNDHHFMHTRKCSCGNTKKPYEFSCSSCCKARVPYEIVKMLDDASEKLDEHLDDLNPEKRAWILDEWMGFLKDHMKFANRRLEEIDKIKGGGFSRDEISLTF